MATKPEEKASAPQMDMKKDMKDGESDITYPSGFKLVLLLVCAFGSMFVVNLDKLIISTAIPKITDTFNSTNDIGWYGSAYLLTNCAFQLVLGKLYKFLPVKPTFLASMLVFEVGSALCGAALSSTALIVGRAIAGIGAGGVLPGIWVILVHALPLHKRPKFQGVFGAVFGISYILGPTLGGAFTTHVSWRWCFYINLPIGGAIMALIAFLLDAPGDPGSKMSLKDKLKQLNLLGTICLVPGVICLCLALQWGGTTYDWNNVRIIVLFVIAFVLLIAFSGIQLWLPEQAILPPRIFIQRSIASGFWASICVGAHQVIFLYYLPIWFQAIQHKSAIGSGVALLAMVIPTAVASIVTGALVSRIGYYTPFLILGTCCAATATGLLTTLRVHTSEAKWIGYQILYGFGQGFASMGPNTAAQTVLEKQDIPIGVSLMFFGQTLFSAVFVSVGQNLIVNQLKTRLAQIPGIDLAITHGSGATNILNTIKPQYRLQALEAYNGSLRVVFQVALIMACLAVPGAACMEWRTVKKNIPNKPSVEQDNEKGEKQANLNEDDDKAEGRETREMSADDSEVDQPHGKDAASTRKSSENA